jgi:hypothetical protein
MRIIVLSSLFCVAIGISGAAGYIVGHRAGDCSLRLAQPTSDDSKYAAQHAEQVSQRKAPIGDASPVVPTADVAAAIHSAVCGAIYGKREIAAEQPFTVVRSGDFWVVGGYLPPNMLGGVAVTVIRASNGEVIDIEHQM